MVVSKAITAALGLAVRGACILTSPPFPGPPTRVDVVTYCPPL